MNLISFSSTMDFIAFLILAVGGGGEKHQHKNYFFLKKRDGGVWPITGGLLWGQSVDITRELPG